MYNESVNAILTELNTITVDSYTNMAYQGPVDTRVKPFALQSLKAPKIVVQLYDEQFDHLRQDADRYYRFDADSTSMPYIEAPQPWNLFYQINAITRSQHHEQDLKTAIKRQLGSGKDLEITFVVAETNIVKTCHLSLVASPVFRSSTLNNRFEGEVYYSYKLETWLWPDADPLYDSVLKQRIVRIGDPGESETFNYEHNLDI